MKIALSLLLFVVAGCSEAVKVSPATALAASNSLASDLQTVMLPEMKGRYQLIAAQIVNPKLGTMPAVFKLDTATGDAWLYSETSVANTNFDQSITAAGWQSISNSFLDSISSTMRLAP